MTVNGCDATSETRFSAL